MAITNVISTFLLGALGLATLIAALPATNSAVADPRIAIASADLAVERRD
jgi:hypothetical protein